MRDYKHEDMMPDIVVRYFFVNTVHIVSIGKTKINKKSVRFRKTKIKLKTFVTCKKSNKLLKHDRLKV